MQSSSRGVTEYPRPLKYSCTVSNVIEKPSSSDGDNSVIIFGRKRFRVIDIPRRTCSSAPSTSIFTRSTQCKPYFSTSRSTVVQVTLTDFVHARLSRERELFPVL